MALADLHHSYWPAYIPWTNGTRRRWYGRRRPPLMTPFVTVYLAAVSILPLSVTTWKPCK